MPPSPLSSQRRATPWPWPVRLLAAGLLVAWGLLVLSWAVLHWVILPQVGAWRAPIERHASAVLGVPLRIAQIDVDSRGWVPALTLRGVELLDEQGRVALHLPHVAAAVSARSLLALELRFEQLLIDAPQLEVRRDANGHLHVAGLDLSRAQGDSDGAAADWIFEQHEVVVRKGRVRWVDELRAAPPLDLTDVDLVIRNGLRRREVRLDVTPPPTWGDRLSVRAQLTQPLLARAGDWQRWSGEVYAELPRAQVDELRRYVALPFDVNSGSGALRAWMEFARGQPRSATVDLALAGVEVRLARGLQPLAFERVEGRVVAQRDNRSFSLAAEKLAFVTGDGVTWPSGSVRLAVRHSADASAGMLGGQVNADRLDLGIMAQIAERLPLGQAVRGLLTSAAPRGVAHGLELRWDGDVDAPQRYDVKARLSEFSVASAAAPTPGAIGRPGWRNASVDVSATERGGDAALKVLKGSLSFPGVFDQPDLSFDDVSALINWRIDASPNGQPAQIAVQVRDGLFANDDVRGDFSAKWRTGSGEGFARNGRFPGHLELNGKLSRARAAATARYLPGTIPANTRQYLMRAVQGGEVTSASFRVKGGVWDFPFENAKDGEFRITAKLRDVGFAYLPSEPGWDSPWPAFSQVSGDLIFDRLSLQLRNVKARVHGLEWRGIQGGIQDLHGDTPLRLEGQARGPLADVFRIVNSTPIGDWLGQGLRQTVANGDADLRLALELPLAALARTTVKGQLTLSGNDVQINRDLPALSAARARVDFTEHGFTLTGASAKALGGDVVITGGMTGDDGLRVALQGQASAEGLRRAGERGWLSQLAGQLQGQAAYRAQIALAQGELDLRVTSPLIGMALDLPAPLGKAAQTPLALSYQVTPLPKVGEALRDRVQVSVGDRFSAVYDRQWRKDQVSVLQGAIGVGAPAPPATAAVSAVVDLDTIDVDAWTRLMDTWQSSDIDRGGASYLPASVGLRARSLQIGGRPLTQVVAGLTRHADTQAWKANVTADQLKGHVEWRPAAARAGAGLLVARLDRLTLPAADADSLTPWFEQATLPSLDIVIEDFGLRGRRLGRVEVDAVSRGVAEWQLRRLAMTLPEAQLQATGQWRGGARAAAGMAMNFQLDIKDSGQLLERFGHGQTVRGGKGSMQGTLAWQGSPLGLHFPSLSGQMQIALDQGQFLKAEAGAGKLLSVLSLQTLPRRLLLDFRDLFQDGFVFDAVNGDVGIAKGVASTNNLRIRGVQAVVLMEGRADIARETQDLQVHVVPEINAGTASLAYAVINPAIGLGTFLAQWVLRKPLMEAGTREFHITGAWADPKVERIERGADKPTSDATAPPR